MIKFVLDNFDAIFRTKNSLDNLEKIMLDLAVRGKLVPQDPRDEPASELLKRIKEEKERLIGEKVIKKEKALPPISKEEIPFDIPSSWEWVRLGEIYIYGSGGTVNPKEIKNEEWVLELEDIEKDTSKIIQYKYNNERLVKSNKNRFIKNDVLYAKLRPYLNKVLVAPMEGVCSSEIISIREVSKLNSYYLVLQLKSTFFSKRINMLTYGTKMPRLGTSDAEKSLITLPPLAEQQRIVEKVEKLKLFINKLKEIYDSNEKNRLDLKKSLLSEIESSSSNSILLNNLELIFENFNNIVKTKDDVKDIRSLILSLAVKGKIVPQDPKDEPASELLKRIKEEKERLIADKVIKKEKALPPISREEIPFDIPSSWEWVRLGDVGNWGSGSTPSRSNTEYYLNGNIPWIKTGELNDGYIDYSEEKITELAFKNTSLRMCKPNDILIAMYGATIGKLGILNIEATTNQACCACTVYKGIDNIYLYNYLLSQRNFFKFQGVGGAQPNISKEKIVNSTFPLPPLAEQQRIVEKVDSLMKVCDILESKIESSEKISKKLLESLIK